MDYSILGPLEVRREGRPIPLRGSKQRALLAMLLLHANQVVPRERLVTELWGGDPPETAPKMIQNAVSQLRKLMPGDAVTGPVLATLGSGYVMRVERGQLDADRFERLAAEGRRELAQGRPEEAAAALRQALALWRGPALSDLAEEAFAEAEIARLEDLRIATLEDRIDADLALGHNAELVPELERLVAEHPLRERLRGQLMLALYRSGRQAEALESYQRTRHLLVEELGLEPAPALQRLERGILQQDPALELAPPEVDVGAEPVTPAAAAGRTVRKTVTVAFAEVVVVGGPLDPEASLRLVEPALEAATAALERHGGAVERLASGELMAVFGVPRVEEDDPLRAVRALLEARDAVATATAEPEDGRAAVALRAAVDTGEVLTHDSEVAGDAVSWVHHLAQAAGPGEVLLGEGSEAVVRSGVRLEPVDPESRGLAGGARAWTLVDVLAGAEPIPRRRDAPLVGRSAELAQLRQALDRVSAERTAHLFTILGPPGIGKSRLAAEFADSLGGSASIVLGRADPHGEGLTFRSLAEAAAAAAGAGIVPPAPASTPDEAVWAVRRLLESAARRRPLVAVLEDLHWAEPTVLDLVEHVAEWSRDAPILLLCLARRELLERRPAWSGGYASASTLHLEPLTPGDAAELIDRLAAERGLPHDVRARIMEAAEGNPLFLEQILAMVEEHGALDADVPVPPTLQALLEARLDRLTPLERLVLERGAVIGREFWEGALEAVTPDDERAAVRAQLGALVRRDLVRPCRSRIAGEEAFRFRHALIHETAYGSVPKETRAALHARVAEWLEHGAAELSDHDELVGRHLERSYRCRAELGPPDDAAVAVGRRAAQRLAAAGRDALGRADMPAAVGLLARAEELADDDAPGRAELLLDLGEALRETGDFRRAGAVLAEVQASAAAAGDKGLEAHASVTALRVRLHTDPELTTDDVLRQARRAVDAFSELGDERGLGRAWELLAWSPWFRCRAAEAAEALERALEHARRAGDVRTEARSVHLLVGAALFGPTPVDEAVRLCGAIITRPGEQQSVRASALRALAGLSALKGDFDEARLLFLRHKEVLEDLGLPVKAAWSAETGGTVELLAGDPEAAERELRDGYETLGRLGETGFQTLAALLAQAVYAQERYEEALELTKVSEQDADDALSSQIQWRAVRAKALAQLGDAEEAERLAGEAAELAAETDFLVMAGDALMDLAEVVRLRGRPEEAVDHAERALALYERKEAAAPAERARAIVGALPTTRSGARS